MSTPTHESAMDAILQEARELHLRKHHDYTGKPILRSGQAGIRIRLFDKLDRLENLAGKDPAVQEARRDTWMDVMVYAMLAVMLEDGTFQLPASWEVPGATASTTSVLSTVSLPPDIWEGNLDG